MNKFLNNDFSLSVIKKSVNIFSGLITVILLNRYLGVELKGEYTFLYNYVVIISSVLQLGISSIYPNFKRKKVENCFEIFISLSIIQLIIYIILSIIIMFITKLNINIMWICILSVVSIFTSQIRYINLVEHYKYNSFVIICTSITNIFVMLIAYLFFKSSLMSAFIILIIKDLSIVLMLLNKINFSRLLKKQYIKIYGSIIKNGFAPMVSNLLIILNYKIDIIMLNKMNVSFYSIGLYSVGLSIAEYVWLIPDIFKDVIQKRTAVDNATESINFSIRISTTIIIVIFIGLLLFGKQAITLLFGQDYSEAFVVTVILFMGVYSMIYYKIIGALFIADNKSKQYFLILLIGTIINIIINILLIPKFEVKGAAIASVVSYSFIGILFLMLYKKYYKVNLREILFVNKEDLKKIKLFLKK